MVDVKMPPAGLYTLQELNDGFDPSDPTSIVRTYSFDQYRAYYPIRKSAVDLNRLQRVSDHDVRISTSLAKFLKDHEAMRPIGIMGGHSMSRDDGAYKAIARLARRLSNENFLVVTGGGPGAMEAGHVGAYYRNATDSEFETVLGKLAASRQKKIPRDDKTKPLLDDDGTLHIERNPAYVQALFEWYDDAATIRSGWKGEVGESLAVSTWYYGEEPVMPFGTAYAAYFQNSIREASLVRDSLGGIVYAKGGGGTLREIFQDVEENYYGETNEDITPMIFFDLKRYWDQESPKPGSVKLDDVLLQRIFPTAYPPERNIDYANKILFTTDVDRIVAALKAYNQKTHTEFVAMINEKASA